MKAKTTRDPVQCPCCVKLSPKPVAGWKIGPSTERSRAAECVQIGCECNIEDRADHAPSCLTIPTCNQHVAHRSASRAFFWFLPRAHTRHTKPARLGWHTYTKLDVKSEFLRAFNGVCLSKVNYYLCAAARRCVAHHAFWRMAVCVPRRQQPVLGHDVSATFE